MSPQQVTTDAAHPVARRPGVRQVAGVVYRLLIFLILVCVATQFFLAGFGTFSRQEHGVSDGYFEVHVIVGFAIGVLTLVLFISAAAYRLGRPDVLLVAALFVLAGTVEPLLARLGDSSSAWFGAAHALTGAGIAALTGALFARSRRSQPAFGTT